MALFIFNCGMLWARFALHRGTFRASAKHPTESLFIPASIISVGTILLNVTQYGVDAGHTGPWLEGVMVVMYWAYCALAVAFSFGIYLIM